MPRPKDPARAAAGVPVFSNALGNGDPVDPDDVPVVVRLSAEETFYLAHTLGCLTVHSVERGTPPGEEPLNAVTGTGEDTWLMRLSLEELWTALLANNAGGAGGAYFIARCAAHVVQRREGWLPRSGLQYGADLVLYRNHPSLVHSDHCVVLRPGQRCGLRRRRQRRPSPRSTATTTTSPRVFAGGRRCRQFRDCACR